jgi:hypothetical protein
LGVHDHGAVVHVHHVRRLDKRVEEVLAAWVQRMVNLERAATFGQ